MTSDGAMNQSPVWVVADDQALDLLSWPGAGRVRWLDNYLQAIGEMACEPAQAVVGGLEAVGAHPEATLRALRHRNPQVRLVLTADARDEQEAMRLVRLGFDDYLIRPLEPAELRQTLSAAKTVRPAEAAGKQSVADAAVLKDLHESREVWLPKAVQVLGERVGAGLIWRTGEAPAENPQEISAPVEGLGGAAGNLCGPSLLSRALLLDAAAALSSWMKLADRLEEATRLADLDPLTNLWNRRYLEKQFPRLLAEVREHRRMLSVVLWDLDSFKQYNDGLGHAAGDQMLKQVAACLTAAVRREDWVVRLGGDEFCMVLPEQPSRRPGTQHRIEVADLIERVRKGIASAAFAPMSPGLAVPTLSAGAATFPWDGSDWAGLIESADRLLRVAKADGKNRVLLSPE